MNLEEVKENLCIYDTRNPDYDWILNQKKTSPCYCDNCFTGRDKLANELLKRWYTSEGFAKTYIKDFNKQII